MSKYEDKALEIMRIKSNYDRALLENPDIMELSQSLGLAKEELKNMIQDELKNDFYSSTTDIHVTKVPAKKVFDSKKFALERNTLYKKYCTKIKKESYRIYL
tara:strand:- start:237 stop:542 length:306 start_codon:yes stop_codon:yes gene_type:complete